MEGHFRLSVRERDRDFFQSSVQEKGKLFQLLDQPPTGLPDSQQRMIENASQLRRELSKLDDEGRNLLTTFLIRCCYSVRRFVGLRLSGPLPDETTILNFRHLLEEHELGQGLFEEINRHLESQGLRLREGTIVDASIIEAPSSTKNRAGRRDPEMRQTKKGNEWRFGMKVHIGADAETGVVHSVTTTPANVHDLTEAHRLLHGGENRVWGDAGYQGVDKRLENRELDVDWQVAMRPGRRRQLEPGSYEALMEKRKASTRA